mgnify:CR=1 FL=1
MKLGILIRKLKLAMNAAGSKLDPENERVLLILHGMYQDLDMQAKLKPLAAKMKKLGLMD